MNTPLVVLAEDFKNRVHLNIKEIQFVTSTGFQRVITCESLDLDFDSFFAKRYGELQCRKLTLCMNRASIWLIWENVVFFQDLVRCFSSCSTIELSQFVPEIWEYRIKFNQIEMIVVTNDKNWVDASTASDNFLLAIVAKVFTIEYDLSYLDFCPAMANCRYKLEGQQEVSVKIRVPENSTVSPLVQSLYENSFFASRKHKTQSPQISKIAEGWLDLLLTDNLIFTCDYTWHCTYQSYPSDLPQRALPKKTTQAKHPFELDYDQCLMEVVVKDSEVFFSGFGIWLIRNFVKNYFGLYSHVSDVDSYRAHTLLSRRLYGDVVHEVELYRPLNVRFSMKLLNARAHCMMHSVKTVGKTPDSCPIINVSQLMVEIAQKKRDFLCQVFVDGMGLSFEKSKSFKDCAEGVISINHLAVRIHYFLSEVGIPWDAVAIEYASAIEVIIGNVIGRIDPIHLVCLVQIVEGINLMSAAVDEELLIPEMYDLCHHMNDVRTCPRSNLKLTDQANRLQNCEIFENLEYRLVRASIENVDLLIVDQQCMMQLLLKSTRTSICNCHELSFCTSILFGTLKLQLKQYARDECKNPQTSSSTWIECGSTSFEDIEFEVRLPLAEKQLHLIDERNKFLKKHDERTKRLYFLWLNEKKCGCYGSLAFFGEDDLSGCIFMENFSEKLDKPTITESPMQPGYSQSIVHPKKSLLVNRKTTKSSPESKSKANDPSVENPNALSSGVNDLEISNARPLRSREHIATIKDSTIDLNAASVDLWRPSDWGIDPTAIYAWGNIGSSVKLFFTPLSVEVLQRLSERAEMIITALHPTSIVQHVYGSCASRCHKQPLASREVVIGQSKHLPLMSARIGCPPFRVITMQCMLFDQSVTKKVDRRPITQCSITMLISKETHLNVFTKLDIKANHECVYFDYSTNFHAQFMTLATGKQQRKKSQLQIYQIIDWDSSAIAGRLPDVTIKVVNDVDLPDISLVAKVPREGEFGSHINGSQLDLKFSEPRLHIIIDEAFDRKRWPGNAQFRQAFTGGLSSWLYALCRFRLSLRKTIDKFSQWFDLSLCKALTEAKELREDLILAVCKSALSEVKRYRLASAACASCKLMLFLLRCSAQMDERQKHSYWDSRAACMEACVTPMPALKFALTALLNSWHPLLAPHIKVVDKVSAQKYVRNTCSSEQLKKAKKSNAETDVSNPSKTALMTGETGLLKTVDLNPAEISLPVFFWPLFKCLSLDSGVIPGVPLQKFNFAIRLVIGEFKTYIVRAEKVKGQKSLSQQSHLLLLLDTVSCDGTVSYNVVMDERQLNATKASVLLKQNTNVPRIEIFLTPFATLVVKDLLIAIADCSSISVLLNPVDDLQQTQVGSVTSPTIARPIDDETPQQWVQALVDQVREYRLNNNQSGAEKAEVGEFCFAIVGNIIISAIKLEIKLQRVVVLVRFFNTRMKHTNIHYVNEPEKADDGVVIGVQDVKLLISERASAGAIVIFRGALSLITCMVTGACEVRDQRTSLKTTIEKLKCNYVIGSLMSIKPKVHKKQSSKSNEQQKLTVENPSRLSEQKTSFDFDLQILNGELNVKLTPLITAKYMLKGAQCSGLFPKNAVGSVENHSATYVVFYSKNAPKWMRFGSFPLTLPTISAECFIFEPHGAINIGQTSSTESIVADHSSNSFIKIILTIGCIEQIINTDLLNMIIFSNEVIAGEIVNISAILNSSAKKQADQSAAPTTRFQIQILCDSSKLPWLCLTCTDTTNSALRLVVESMSLTITNRHISGADSTKDLICGGGSASLNIKIGQMIPNEAYQEDELRELAVITTQVKSSLKYGSEDSLPKISITFAKSVLFLKICAITKAKSVWHDFNISRTFWLSHKAVDEGAVPESDAAARTILSATDALAMNISVLIAERFIVCLPLYSNNFRSFTSALLLGVQDAEARINFVQGVSAKTKFSQFKAVFVQNFEQSMDDTWINGQESIATNFLLFPCGACELIVRKVKKPDLTTDRRVVSVNCSFKGLTFDVDSSIGNMPGSIQNTLNQAKMDEDVDANEYESLVVTMSDLEHDAELDPKNEYATIIKPESRIRWVEQKIYEQTKKLDGLREHASEIGYDWEVRRLKKFQMVRLRQFKRSMLERLKKHKIGQDTKVPKVKAKTIGTAENMESSNSSAGPDEDLSVTGQESSMKSKAPEAVQAEKIQSRINVAPTSALRQLQLLADSKNVTHSGDMTSFREKVVIDLQFIGEAGRCILRNKPNAELTSTTSTHAGVNERKNTAKAEATQLTVPSLNVKVYYSPDDPAQNPPDEPYRSMATEAEINSSSPCLYVSANLSNMPQETALTPCLSDFLEELLASLPRGAAHQKPPEVNLDSEIETQSIADTESLLTGLESRIKMNILATVNIQSSSLRFEAHQQRTATMDLLLRLPSFKFVVCVRHGLSSNGVDLSLTLSSFSICFYNPLQPSPLDAFSLTLDSTTVGLSRIGKYIGEQLNVKIVGSIKIGIATFTYDMRRLSELIAFPRPWYRRKIAQQLLFGHSQIKHTRSTTSLQTTSWKPPNVGRKKLVIEALLSASWEAFTAKVRMSSVMGDTKWDIQRIAVHLNLSSNANFGQKFHVRFALPLLALDAVGGAISGSTRLSNTVLDLNWSNETQRLVSISLKAAFTELEARIEWMGHTVLVALFHQPSLLLFNEWTVLRDPTGNVKRALLSISGNMKWSKLQLIITKVTFSNIGSIINKLQQFFEEQVRNSHKLLEQSKEELSKITVTGTGVAEQSSKLAGEICQWSVILDRVTDIQMRSVAFPMPDATDGRTIVGAYLAIDAQQASLVLMDGDINVNRWALFYLNEPSVIFVNAAEYTFLNAQQTIGIDLVEKLLLKLGGTVADNRFRSSSWTSAVCKVERRPSQPWPKTFTVHERLAQCIDEALTQLFSPNRNSTGPNVMELFELPALDAAFCSQQKMPITISRPTDQAIKVECIVTCKFHHAIGVQTDFTTQVNFLPELLKSYLTERDEEERKTASQLTSTPAGTAKSSAEKNVIRQDKRQFMCTKWQVDPKIQFIDKVRWDPPVIDDVLRKLQIFDHRTTIPKVVQRNVLDPCGQLASSLLFCTTKLAKKTLKKNKK